MPPGIPIRLETLPSTRRRRHAGDTFTKLTTADIKKDLFVYFNLSTKRKSLSFPEAKANPLPIHIRIGLSV